MQQQQQQQQDLLARTNAHPRDAGIHFHEPTHVYTIKHDARTRYMSVTTFLGSLFHGDDGKKNNNTFDAPKMARKIASQPNEKRSKREYWDKTAAELEAMWSANGDAARTLGTALHLDVERFFNRLPTVAAEQAAQTLRAPPPPSREMQFFYDWWSSAPEMAANQQQPLLPQPTKSLEPWRTEWCVYWEEYALAGSIDMVFRDRQTGQLAVYDWKRVCKDLTPDGHLRQRWTVGYASKAAGLDHVPDTPFWHYALQLNLYKRILESKYGVQVTPPLVLVVMHPDNAAAMRIELPELPEEIDAALAHRKRRLLLKKPPPRSLSSLHDLACKRTRLLGLPEPPPLEEEEEDEEEQNTTCCAFAGGDKEDDALEQQRKRKLCSNARGGCAFAEDEDDDAPQRKKK